MSELRFRWRRWRTRRAWKTAGRAIDRANRLMDAAWADSTGGAVVTHRDWLPTILAEMDKGTD